MLVNGCGRYARYHRIWFGIPHRSQDFFTASRCVLIPFDKMHHCSPSAAHSHLNHNSITMMRYFPHNVDICTLYAHDTWHHCINLHLSMIRMQFACALKASLTLCWEIEWLITDWFVVTRQICTIMRSDDHLDLLHLTADWIIKVKRFNM